MSCLCKGPEQEKEGAGTYTFHRSKGTARQPTSPGTARARPDPGLPRVSSQVLRPQSLTPGTYAARRGARGARPGPATYRPLGGSLLSSRLSLPAPPLPCLPGLALVRAPTAATPAFPGKQELGLRTRARGNPRTWDGWPFGHAPNSLQLSSVTERGGAKEDEDTEPGPGLLRPCPAFRVIPSQIFGRPAHFWPPAAHAHLLDCFASFCPVGWEGARGVARVSLSPLRGRSNNGGPGDPGGAGAALRRPPTRKQVSGCGGRHPNLPAQLGLAPSPAFAMRCRRRGARAAGAGSRWRETGS